MFTPTAVTGTDADELNELRAWFSENLEKATSFGRDKLRLGICWFKTGANEHISRIWKMVKVLEPNGIYAKKNQNRQARLCHLRRRMATCGRTLPHGNNAEEMKT